MSKKKNAVGRPTVYKWGTINLLWKSKTNSEIAEMLGCTYQNVIARRKRLIAKEQAKGAEGHPEKYTSKYEAWSRGKNKTSQKQAVAS